MQECWICSWRKSRDWNCTTDWSARASTAALQWELVERKFVKILYSAIVAWLKKRMSRFSYRQWTHSAAVWEASVCRETRLGKWNRSQSWRASLSRRCRFRETIRRLWSREKCAKISWGTCNPVKNLIQSSINKHHFSQRSMYIDEK